MVKKYLTIFFIIGLSFGLYACSSNADGESTEKLKSEENVIINEFKFTPARVTLKAGGRVTWANEDRASHKLKFEEYEWEPEDLSSGMLMVHKFSEPGTFSYSCELHENNPDEHGTIIVKE